MKKEKYKKVYETTNLDELIGKTFIKISTIGGTTKYPDGICLETKDKIKYILAHNQHCCEFVSVKDIIGDLQDLLNEPITIATSEKKEDKSPREFKNVILQREEFIKNEKIKKTTDVTGLWTFYKLATKKGEVNISWFGLSWRYSVDIEVVKISPPVVKEILQYKM